MNNHTIIIENDASLASAMTLALEAVGYEVTVFGSLTRVEQLAGLHTGFLSSTNDCVPLAGILFVLCCIQITEQN